MLGYKTIREVVATGFRSESWIRAAIRLGKLRAIRVGNIQLIADEEFDRIRYNPPKISRREMDGK
jgi:hypothetical protein